MKIFIIGIAMLAIGILWLLPPIEGWFLGYAWPEVRTVIVGGLNLMLLIGGLIAVIIGISSMKK
jgi:hypothetical protein